MHIDKGREREWGKTTIYGRVGRGMKSTNKGWTEGERKTRVDVLRNNDIKMAKAWMIY